MIHGPVTRSLVYALFASLVLLAPDPALAAAYRVVRAFPVAPEPACMPAVTRAPNGDVLVAFSTEWEPAPGGGVVRLTVSTDQGTTWSEPTTLWAHEDPGVTIQVSGGLQTLSNGDVLLPVNCGKFPPRKGATEGNIHHLYDIRPDNPDYRREVRLLRSSDSGRLWAIEDPKVGRSWPRYGRLLETRDGRLIMTGYGWYAASRDFGRTWGPTRWVEDGIRSEMNMVQAADGTLFTMLRGAGHPPRRTLGTRRSTDGGNTWGPMGSLRDYGAQGKMPDLLVLPSGRILMVLGAVGLEDGGEHVKQTDRFSFTALFISDDHGVTWTRDIDFAQVDPGGSIVPADGPGLCALDDGRVLVVLQGMDRSQAGRTWYSFHDGMSVIANIIEPARPDSTED